ncbi:MAG TPA: hypothetical protein VNN73_14015 [Blastocatellia bacterium]|nr:hypothetical protein [Blastocatellia bacterium]
MRVKASAGFLRLRTSESFFVPALAFFNLFDSDSRSRAVANMVDSHNIFARRFVVSYAEKDSIRAASLAVNELSNLYS